MQIQALVHEQGALEIQKVNIPCDTSTDLGTGDCNAAESTFQFARIVGIHLYMAMRTRPDIVVCTNMLAKMLRHQVRNIRILP